MDRIGKDFNGLINGFSEQQKVVSVAPNISELGADFGLGGSDLQLDDGDAALAKKTVVAKFNDFLQEPEEREKFGMLIDGKTSDERSEEENAKIDQLIEITRQEPDSSAAKAVKLELKAVSLEVADDLPPHPVRALVTSGPDQRVTIYLANDLGLRDTLLASHDAYCDFVTCAAKDLGIDVLPGDVAGNLREIVNSGHFPVGGRPEGPPEPIRAIVNGIPVTGIPR